MKWMTREFRHVVTSKWALESKYKKGTLTLFSHDQISDTVVSLVSQNDGYIFSITISIHVTFRFTIVYSILGFADAHFIFEEVPGNILKICLTSI